MSGSILVTGGAGYIGSHCCVELLDAGHDVVVLDNLSNSSEESLRRVGEITGKALRFEKLDLLDADGVDRLFAAHSFDAVIHFAGLKAVGESTEIPLTYYQNNVTGTLNLLESMKKHGVNDLVFSSSATVYGDPASVPIREDFPLSATNPYGRSKLMIEEILRDLAKAESNWRFILLRYFNPVGAHASGRIGEDPTGIPNNLMPFVMQVAAGRRERVGIFGDDYPTKDGTGVRDYIHVVDLVLGHLAALDALGKTEGCVAYNLGTGNGYSVKEMIEAARKASGKEIPAEVVARRPGDIATCYADPAIAAEKLGWSATRGLDEMVADAWRWQEANPDGYSS
ncbi:MAG: UDP-glucose 4-epimerase GalE [Planctomycetota bacterium]|jgi:UDP-glucose 4-epimerase